MAYDEGLAQRVREVLDDGSDVTEKTMFGGVASMLGGNMFRGMIYVAKPDIRDAAKLAKCAAREVRFAGALPPK